MNHRKHHPSSSSRRGAFTVEFAIVASIFFMVLLSCFEFARLSFIRHSLDQAAYEAARVGIVQGGDVDDVEEKALASLRATRIKPLQIDVEPALIDDLTETVSVTITCNVVDNSWIPSTFFKNPTITARAVLDHENQAYLVKPDSQSKVGNNDDEPIDT